ncbi:very short patch repair endonuclease [Erythrobacter sp.]|uniref:very short patch repair endonuclease n=1 Tax=Erythrobacter sp. TaxID=1042 RepID=UPI001B0B9421|nr:very short patch repair endonuclease [Erythrobacter sp.]MBO6527843.1 DNA mismatch endonuclease Vsr [Erythrobacter sp.]MBO6531460.1 DNA mismatch endonuclease Vsr [Erythrobacter sp.]
MADIVSKAVRSRMMSGIKGKDTKPELLLRQNLHRRGFRYRLHSRNLPGRPDMVFPQFDAVLFAHGCFWHGHDCSLFRWPQTRREFWEEKIRGNQARDIRNKQLLLDTGWRVGKVWECALRGRDRIGIDEVIEQCANWLEGTAPQLELRSI